MASVDSLTASFFDNEQYSDIVIKFGEHHIRAHKVILAQQSGYFATAFLGLFQVSWNSIIDIGDEDDPRLLTNVIKFLYHHGPIHDQVKGSNRMMTLQQLIDVYLLADKYDIHGLRRTIAKAFNEMALVDLRQLRQNNTFKSTFVKHIARIWGPFCFQLADDTLQALVVYLCAAFSSTLFKDETFLQQYMKGELFDSKHAAAFGAKLGKDLLKSRNKTHEEITRHSKNWDPSLIGIEARQRITKNFFDDKKLSDVLINHGIDQTIAAHKIILATHSREFQKMLADSPKGSEIDLKNENCSSAVTVFIKDLYVSEFPVPDVKHDACFLAELYLLARKHGRDAMARTYLMRFNSALYREPFADKYLSDIADFCGPDSCRYTDTALPEEAFDNILYRVIELKHEETTKSTYNKFAQKLEGGSLFNAVFMGRFAKEMTSRYLKLESKPYPDLDDE